MASEACHQAPEFCTEPLVFTWMATLVLLGLVLVGIAAFWYWWRLPNRKASGDESLSSTEAPTREGYIESRERLDLLRGARRWGDVSTTYDTYLRRRR